MNAVVLSNKNLEGGYRLVRIECGSLAQKFKPGQFLMVKVTSGCDPLLRRPMSYFRAHKVEGWIEVLFHVVGKGTTILSSLKKGHTVDILAPLGNGFTLKKKKNFLLVGGGVGIAPLMALLEGIQERGYAHEELHVYIGGRTSQDILRANEFRKKGAVVQETSEDGSSGKMGLVTEPLLEFLETQKKKSSTIIYACGPYGMLKAVHQIAEYYSVECQVSLENKMACGTGACLGCSRKFKGKKPEEPILYKTVCQDGPVFDSREVLWV